LIYQVYDLGTMKFFCLLSLIYTLQNSGYITKNSGEEIPLNDIMLYQSPENGKSDMLLYNYRGEERSISINEVKRINLKENLNKKKGITTWNVLIVTRKNEKYEAQLDLVEVRGTNSEGKQEIISSSVINKISF